MPITIIRRSEPKRGRGRPKNKANNPVQELLAAKKKRTRNKPSFLGIRKALSREQLLKIERELVMGTKPTDVARMIHGDFQLLLDLSGASLGRQLERLRDDSLLPAIAATSKGLTKGRNKGLLAKLEIQLDVIAEMSQLAMLQKERIAKAMAVEDGMPLLFQWVTREVSEFRKLLQSVADLQLETGILKRASRTLKVGVDLNIDTRHDQFKDEVADFTGMKNATRLALEELEMMDVLEGEFKEVANG